MHTIPPNVQAAHAVHLLCATHAQYCNWRLTWFINPYIAQVCINSRLSTLDPELQVHPMTVFISRITSFKSNHTSIHYFAWFSPLFITSHPTTLGPSCSLVNTIDKKNTLQVVTVSSLEDKNPIPLCIWYRISSSFTTGNFVWRCIHVALKVNFVSRGWKHRFKSRI